ncbi:hypothetical protein AK812_SmicGene47147 [Symbiodinium microadriaticum]|uniref:Uncharacterized protein n=1 Tax=Symbiodinium microadriaticum TaxID=2951 RepID=A0A1Q9BSI7_SYMMI|nr:hypothetical protein AK812_SmicGene47147 [Symbiodinium microadriaticum]
MLSNRRHGACCCVVVVVAVIVVVLLVLIAVVIAVVVIVAAAGGSKRTASPVELPPNVTASPPIQVPLAPHLSAEKRDDVLDLRFRRKVEIREPIESL